MHVYILPNADGTHSYLVAARNQKEAAKLMNSSTSGFRDYGGHRTDNPKEVQLATSEPGKVWRRKIWTTGPNPWRPLFTPEEESVTKEDVLALCQVDSNLQWLAATLFAEMVAVVTGGEHDDTEKVVAVEAKVDEFRQLIITRSVQNAKRQLGG